MIYSTWNGSYKLLAKVLANKPRKVVCKVVSATQHAFMEGRQILNADLIANEVIDSRLKNSKSGVICKLAIEKVHNRAN